MKDTRLTISSPRTLVAALLFAATVAVSACGGSSDSPVSPVTPTPTPTPTATPAGTYAISTINAKALPVAIFADTGFTYEVTAGTLSLTADNKYSVAITYRQTLPNDVSTFVDSTRGTWAVSSGTVNFTDGLDGSQAQATWSTSASTLTFLTLEGKGTNTYVYLKK
jgi:hypothetical protein